MGTHPIFESDFDCLTEMDPISNIIIVTDARLAPPNSTMYARTVENSDADLWANSFFGKSKKRYICIERQKNAENIISDMCLVRNYIHKFFLAFFSFVRDHASCHCVEFKVSHGLRNL